MAGGMGRRSGPTLADRLAASSGGTPAPVAEGADEVEQVLERPEIVRLLAEFDRRMDQRLARS